MTPFDALKAQLSAVVPFAAYVGVEITDIGEGTATTILTQSQNTSNHIATMHAGALFTLGEKDGALEEPTPQGEIWGMNADGSQTKVLVGWKNSDRTSGRAGGKAALEPVAATLVDALDHDDDKAIIAVYRLGTQFTTPSGESVTGSLAQVYE